MNITSILNLTKQPERHDSRDHVGPKGNDTEARKEAHKQVAEEMESLFAFQLIKTMRETAKSISAEEKSSGHDTYMSMFDMEISKLFAKRGMGLQQSILNWLDRMPGAIHGRGDMEKD